MIKVPKQQPHCRNIRCLGVVVVLLLCELKCWYEATPAEAASFLPSTKKSVSPVELENPSLLFHRHLVSRRKHVLQTLKIWRIRHAVQPNIRFLGIPWTKKKNSRFKNRGFMFTFRKPTKENVGKWYGTNDGIDEDLNNDIQLGVFQKGLVNHGTSVRKETFFCLVLFVFITPVPSMTKFPFVARGKSTQTDCNTDILFLILLFFFF